MRPCKVAPHGPEEHARVAAIRALYLASGRIKTYVDAYTTPEKRAGFLIYVAPLLEALARRFEEETRS